MVYSDYQLNHKDSPGFSSTMINSAIRNVTKRVKLFNWLVTLNSTEKRSDGDMIMWVFPHPTTFKLPRQKGTQVTDNQANKIKIWIPRNLPIFEELTEFCSKNMGKTLYITSASLVDSTVISFNSRTRLKLHTEENKELEQSLHMSKTGQWINGVGFITQSPIQVPTMALPISSQPLNTSSTSESMGVLKDIPSRNPSYPIKVPEIVLPADSLSKPGFLRANGKNLESQNMLDGFDSLSSLPPLEDCLYELATKPAYVQVSNSETWKSTVPAIHGTTAITKEARSKSSNFSVNSSQKRFRPQVCKAIDIFKKKSKRMRVDEIFPGTQEQLEKQVNEWASKAKNVCPSLPSVNLHFKRDNEWTAKAKKRADESLPAYSRADNLENRFNTSSAQKIEKNNIWGTNLNGLSPDKNTSPACELDGDVEPNRCSTEQIEKSIESTSNPSIPPYIPPENTQDTTTQVNRKPLLNLFIPSPKQSQKRRVTYESFASSVCLWSPEKNLYAQGSSKPRSKHTKPLTSLTALPNDLGFTSLTNALKFCKERLRNLHLWCNVEELKKLKSAPRFYPNLKEPFNVQVRVRVLSKKIDDLVKRYCRDCHICLDSIEIESDKSNCRHLKNAWRWFAKLRLSDSSGEAIEALLVGIEAEEFFCGILAEELKMGKRARFIVENFIAAIEGSTVPLDIGLLAYENENGDVAWLVKRTQGRISV